MIIQNTVDLFEKKFFLNCIADGLKNKDSFVRKHYIKFSQKIVPYMMDVLEEKSAARLLKIIIRAFVDLMVLIDASGR